MDGLLTHTHRGRYVVPQQFFLNENLKNREKKFSVRAPITVWLGVAITT